jgi:aspartyl-tRNA(Asn)/glutamyl-tRNA(Gln) amidotransferase subunit C
MTISTAEVARMAKLARLAIAPEDAPGYAEQLSRIIAFVEQLNEVDTRGIEPMAHPLDLAQRLRADSVTETNQRDAFQAIAPRTERGLYLVPKVIE